MDLDAWEEKHGQNLQAGVVKTGAKAKNRLGKGSDSGAGTIIDVPVDAVHSGKPKKSKRKRQDTMTQNTTGDVAAGDIAVASDGFDGAIIDGIDDGVRTAVVPYQLPPSMTASGWRLPDEISEDDWDRAAESLKRAEGGVQWWYGDWWLKGREQKWWAYGEGQGKADSLGIDYKTIANYAAVAKAFPIERRRPGLPFTHHAEVSGLKGKKREALLDRAQEEGLSARKLRLSVVKDKAVKKAVRAVETAEELGQYAVIYADPPWKSESTGLDFDTGKIDTKTEFLTLEEIVALPALSMAAPDSMLYLWAPNVHLKNALIVMESWGFAYIGNIAWVKDKFGGGTIVRNQHELLLIGRRGDPGIPEACSSYSSVIEAPVRDDGRKPDEVYDLIDACWADTRKLELFARNEDVLRDGWSVWGQDVSASESVLDGGEADSLEESE